MLYFSQDFAFFEGVESSAEESLRVAQSRHRERNHRFLESHSEGPLPFFWGPSELEDLCQPMFRIPTTT